MNKPLTYCGWDSNGLATANSGRPEVNMSRSGYVEDEDEPLAAGRWRAQVKSAIRGKRGQAFLKELAAEMDAMPVKELISEELINEDGDCCAIGVVCKARGIDVSKVDPEEPDQVAKAVGIDHQLVRELEYYNDECGETYRLGKDGKHHLFDETPAEKWQRMREWVEKRIKK